MKNKIFITIIIINIIITYFIILSNYKNNNLNIEEKSNNYNYNNVALYQKKDTEECKNSTEDICYEEISTMPSGNEYTINSEKSTCYLRKEEQHHDRLYTNAAGEHVIQNMLKEEKCYVYFDKVAKHEANITIIAKSGEDTISFPTKDDGKNPISVTCTNDVTAKFDYTNWEVEVDAIEDDETTCTVYFEDFIPQAFNTYLTENQEKLGLVNENGLRYEGASVNNYVLFNDELWRVIGVFDVETENGETQNLVKLIKAEALDGLAWDRSDKIVWETASLQKSLNSGYLNASDEECVMYSDVYPGYMRSVTKICKFSETGIKNGAREKIEAVKWNIGASTSETAEAVYTSEITTKTTGYYKVGLMSASDYGYAVLAESCERTTRMSSYNKSICAGRDWLNNISYEWTLTISGSGGKNALFLTSGVYLSEHDVNIGFNFRPSVYLKSTIQALGGTGASDNPYILK